jgi:hypothetical protein
LASKIIISKELTDKWVAEYNKTFAKWCKAKGAKKEALGMELERLNEKINQ